MISESLWVELTYIVAAVLFLISIKRLGSPATARSGNALGALAVALAVIVTLVDRTDLNLTLVAVAIAIGAVIGAVFARRVPMTAMPQLVALFNGFGGGASALIAAAEYIRLHQSTQNAGPLGEVVRSVGAAVGVDTASVIDPATAASMAFGVAVGALTFSGSMVAFAKLQELIQGRPIVYPFQQGLNLVMAVATVVLGVVLVYSPTPLVFSLVTLLPLVLGVTAVIRIGGADMPVVISLLNSLSGVALIGAGFVIGSGILVVSGAMVGAAGLILTQIMSRAMNRPISNVLFGAFGAEQAAVEDGEEKVVRSVSAEEAAMVLGFAQSVIVVPGYGLAVAQAQHSLAELADLLEGRRATVKYAIHPVAGRMPGHMNVLLAEANISYDKLYDLDEINSEFDRTDVVIVIGANDVVNPDARTDQQSPLYGMPILNADRARSILVLKRSMSPGFSGVDNPLFYDEKTMMLFGDAKDSVVALVNAVKDL